MEDKLHDLLNKFYSDERKQGENDHELAARIMDRQAKCLLVLDRYTETGASPGDILTAIAIGLGKYKSDIELPVLVIQYLLEWVSKISWQELC